MDARDYILKAKQDRIDNIYNSFDKSLWDNIRANRGSGKKPTPEMLKQAEKIKREEAKKSEEVEKAIPERYKNMGFTKVGQKKRSTREGKKWMVLAKKGDQYKVVHGGDDDMKDFSQHKNKERKERFWERHGGRDSKHATDPFSPLYWHKRFKTW